MDIRTSQDPRYVEDDIRFRTTYFFRVYDYCQKGNGNQQQQWIKTDSLYRFIMTGKANSLFSKVHFESGTLKSHEIDPLGSDVAYDDKNRRFFLKSRSQTEREQACVERDAEIERLTKIRATLKDATLEAAKGKIDGRIASLIDSSACSVGNTLAQQPLTDPQGYFLLAGDKLDQGKKYDSKTNDYVAPLVGVINAVTDLGQSMKSRGRDFSALALPVPLTTDSLNGLTNADNLKSNYQSAFKAISAFVSSLSAAKNNWLSRNYQLAVAAAELKNAANSLGAAKNAIKDAELKEKDAANKASLQEAARILEDVGTSWQAAADNLLYASESNVSTDSSCDDGKPAKRGFMILGPEGWKVFDPDDRLLMAMTVDSEPLISMLKDTSARLLNEQTSPAQALPALLKQERVAIDGKSKLDATNLGGEDGSFDNLFKIAKQGITGEAP